MLLDSLAVFLVLFLVLFVVSLGVFVAVFLLLSTTRLITAAAGTFTRTVRCLALALLALGFGRVEPLILIWS